MRKFFLILLSVYLGSSFAQTYEDVELLMQQGLYGTPRYTAMGGAFTSLGGDMSGAVINPAGLAVYNRSAIAGTFTSSFESASLGSFYGTQIDVTNSDFHLENFGLGFQFESNKGKWSKMAFGITYNTLAKFDRDYTISGFNNPYTMAQFWGESSAGLSTDIITDDAFAATEAGLLITDEAFSTILPYGITTSSSDINYQINQRGSLGETNFTFGGQHDKKFYYGVSLGIQSLDFNREELITEYLHQVDTFPFDATQYTYRRNNNIYGAGANLKLGFIYTPFSQLRIGASYQSPTWFTLFQVYEVNVDGAFANGDITESSLLTTGEYSYGAYTPSIWRLGISSVLGKSLILSFDYQYSNPGTSGLYTSNDSYNIDPTIIEESFEPELAKMFNNVQNVAATGLEFKIKNVFLRGGYRWTQSPYQSDVVEYTLSDINTFSGGIGFRFKRTTLDFSYTNSNYSRTYISYTGYDVINNSSVQVLDDLTTDIVAHNISVGITYKF